MRSCEALKFEIGNGEEKREDEVRSVSRACHKRRKELISKQLRFSGPRLSVIYPAHYFKDLEDVAKLEYGEPRILAGVSEMDQSTHQYAWPLQARQAQLRLPVPLSRAARKPA
jgi:hypothetical protein